MTFPENVVMARVFFEWLYNQTTHTTGEGRQRQSLRVVMATVFFEWLHKGSHEEPLTLLASKNI